MPKIGHFFEIQKNKKFVPREGLKEDVCKIWAQSDNWKYAKPAFKVAPPTPPPPTPPTVGRKFWPFCEDHNFGTKTNFRTR